MNKETELIIDFINSSGFYLDKIDKLKVKINNIKDFQVMLGYVVMEIINEEKKFINLSRKNIDLQLITERYF